MIRAEIGSRFAGQPSQTVDQLVARLETEPLRADLAPFIQLLGGASALVRFHGNFARTSCVFVVDTNELGLIARLTAAITANVRRPDYIHRREIEPRSLPDGGANPRMGLCRYCGQAAVNCTGTEGSDE